MPTLLLHAITSTHIDSAPALIVDDRVYSALALRAAIGERGIVDGNFTKAEIRALSDPLNAGASSGR
jgi:preprotein translocase subunit SecD